MLFENNHIENGDDCLTVASGAKNIHFRYVLHRSILLPQDVAYLPNSNSYCEGGHGLSIGSLGKGGSVADVQNVLYVSTSIKVFAVDIFSVGLKMSLWYALLSFGGRGFSTASNLQKNTLYGARFKSWTGGNGLARKFVFFSWVTSQ